MKTRDELLIEELESIREDLANGYVSWETMETMDKIIKELKNENTKRNT